MLTEYVCILRPENSDIPTGLFNVKTEMTCCNNTLQYIYTVFTLCSTKHFLLHLLYIP